jgi:4-amino-4-deoxy-L-arabinose transferase-like glycosyltransferase
MEAKRVILLLLLILILALAVRLFMARYENDIGVDSYHYALMGQNILDGKWDTWDPNGGRWTLPPFFPLLIALFHIFISNIETAGRAAAMFAGILTCFTIFLITRRLYGDKPALVAAFLCAVTPILTDYSTLVLTETTFAFLYGLAMLFSYLTFVKPDKWYYPFLTGFICALMYQTKAYGLCFILFALLIIAIGNRYKFKLGGKFLWKALGLTLIGWLVLVVPYWIFLTGYHGKFVFDGKAVGQLSRMFAHDIPDERIDPRYEGTLIELDDGTLDYAVLHEELIKPPKPLDFVKWFARKYIKKLIQIFWDFPTAFTYPNDIPLLSLLTIFLIGLGLFTIPLNARENFASIFVLLWILPYFTVLPMVFIEVRYFIPLVAVLNIIAALGTLKLAEWLRASFPMFNEKSLYRKHALSIILVLIFIFFLPKNTLKATHAYDPDVFYNEYKIAAEWIKDNYDPVPGPIIEYAHSVSYYSGVRSLQLPVTDVETLVRFARQHDAELIVIDDRFTMRRRTRPALSLLADPERYAGEIPGYGLKLVYVDDKYRDHHVYIYEVF